MNAIQKIMTLIIVLSMSLSGCGGTSVIGYLKSGLTPEQIRSIAVLPFDNISGHPDAGRKVINLLLTELVRTELFRISDMGEVESYLRQLRIRTNAEIDMLKLKRLGEHFDVPAIIIGSIDEYELRQDRSETVLVVAISARMLDVKTGDIIWAVSHTHDGDDWETVFGFGRVISLSRLAQIVLSEIVESLVKGLLDNTEAEMKGKD